MTNNRRRLVGRVVSDKMDKTVVVAIERRQIHRIYKKVVTVRKRVMAHDESNSIPAGTLVRLVESRPLSKRKRWVVEEVIREIEGGAVEAVMVQEEVAEMLGENVEEEDTSAGIKTQVDEMDEAADEDEEAGEADDDDDEETES